jgi:peptidoglycan/LPS O-acetylase OafA/YrhL
MREIRALTSLRGLFALFVFLYHAGIYTPAGRPSTPGLDRGYLAVDFFFILSGFILGIAYGERTQTLASYGRFVWTRFGRLFPLHVTIILLVASVIGIPYFPSFLQELTLTNNLYQNAPHPQLNEVDWSLSTEWVVNLCFPVLVVLARPRFRLVTLAVCLLALFAITAPRSYILDTVVSDPPLLASMVRCFTEFTIGLIASRIRPGIFFSKDSVLFLLIIVVGGLFFVPRTDYLIAILLAPFVYGVSSNSGRVSRILSIAPLTAIGDISFSIYLTHTPIFRVIRHFLYGAPLPAYAVTLIFTSAGLVLTLGVSFLTYNFLEVPARNWFKRVANRWRGAVLTTAAVS